MDTEGRIRQIFNDSQIPGLTITESTGLTITASGGSRFIIGLTDGGGEYLMVGTTELCSEAFGSIDLCLQNLSDLLYNAEYNSICCDEMRDLLKEVDIRAPKLKDYFVRCPFCQQHTT